MFKNFKTMHKRNWKIDKRTLRMECQHISPDGYAPDIDTQMRFSPGELTEYVHEAVADFIDDTDPVWRIPTDKPENVKGFSVYRVLLTTLVFKVIGRLPKKRATAFREAYAEDDGETFCDILDDCIEEATGWLQQTKAPTQKDINVIWNRIKTAYGGKHAPPDEAIFERYEIEDEIDADMDPPPQHWEKYDDEIRGPIPQPAAEQDTVRNAFAELERERPDYVQEGKDRAKQRKAEGWEMACPACDTDLEILCILPPLPGEARHINIGEDGHAETTPIGEDFIVNCPGCGNYAWVNIDRMEEVTPDDSETGNASV